MEANLPSAFPESWLILSDLNVCLSKVVGKYAAYPEVDTKAFERVHVAVNSGLRRNARGQRLGDLCQELRAVSSCPASELLRWPGGDDTDARLIAIAQAVREYARLEDAIFREILTGLLSWEKRDKAEILKALTCVIRRS